jgi:hypothetical protein
MENFFNKIQEL